MFCPKCNAEYRASFTMCADCHVPLVDSLPEVMQQSDPRPDDPLDAPVELARFVDVRQAEFVLMVLEGSGIEGYVDSAFSGNIAPYLMLGSGGVRVMVRMKDRERAIDVLQSADELNVQDDESD